MSKFIMGLLLGGSLTLAVGVWAQGPLAPAVPSPGVPDWVTRYAINEENARKQCSLLLAQEQDKVSKVKAALGVAEGQNSDQEMQAKLSAIVAEHKAALAKAKPEEKK